MKKHFESKAEIEVLDITDVPMFNQSDNQSYGEVIQMFNEKITASDGVIFATPEYNHSIPSSLKSLIEWLSFDLHPLAGKPVMIVGASLGTQGSSRAQLHLRQILDAPGVDANVMPGYEFLLGNASKAFEKVNGVKVPYEIKPRRAGDIATCYADPTRAKEQLGWVAEKTLDDMCRDTWNFAKKHM